MNKHVLLFGLIVVGTVIASYILNYLGYLTHSSPMRAKTGRTAARSVTAPRVAARPAVRVNSAAKAINNVGPNEYIVGASQISSGFSV